MALNYIVEDDVNIREIERYALKNSGFSVKEFDCGKEFFQAVEKKQPSLVILDIMLPDEDGLDILSNLRRSHHMAKIPIIMVTAKTTEIDKVRGLDMGADDYMTKPFGVMELISRVKALLRRTENIAEDTVLNCANITLDTERHTVKVDDETCELKRNEFELFNYLMLNERIELSRD